MMPLTLMSNYNVSNKFEPGRSAQSSTALRMLMKHFLLKIISAVSIKSNVIDMLKLKLES